MTQPCYKCPDRCQNCHASCEKYAAFRAELDKRREYNKQFQPIDPHALLPRNGEEKPPQKVQRGQPMNKPTNEYIMAIKPEWVALIESKEKTLEIRRTAPYISPPVSENNPIDVWVYETKSNGGRGQVVGRFRCCNIRTFDAHRDDLLLRRAARVPWEKLKEYQGDHTRLYAWDITYYKKLAVPLPLSALGCNFAPQSWCKRKEKKA